MELNSIKNNNLLFRKKNNQYIINYIFPGYNIPISSIAGTNNLKIKKLAKIGLHTVKDLLLHLPIRYEDRTHFYQIKDLKHDIYATIKGKILNCDYTIQNKKMILCKVSDKSGILIIRFFNCNSAMKSNLITGKYILAYGKIKRSKNGTEMIHPKYWIQKNSRTLELEKTLTPIYQTTKGINQTVLRKLTDKALSLLSMSSTEELLPTRLAKNLISLPEALHVLHRPLPSIKFNNSKNKQELAKKRLIIEELLAYNLNMLALREKIGYLQAQPLTINNNLKKKLLDSLSFKPTDSQIRVVKEIEKDMSLNVPMMRLVQGDVGSGKTLVAALAALHAISHGKQVALMVPTELLVEQYINIFQRWFLPLGIKVGWVTGKQKKTIYISQKNIIANGQVQMIVGTHAIFQEEIKFHNLSLVIIDEQHRFGVHQRFTLWEKGLHQKHYPHQLIMTATPIPRTLAMTIYAGLDISIINELPSGRKPVITVAIPDIRRNDVISRIRCFCIKKNRQVYWVCTLIKKSNVLEIQAAKIVLEELKTNLPKLNIGLVHGQMKSSEKKEIIQRFRDGNLHLLVATTVIEIGMDVPNSSLIIIENSERLGLAQLHQLRGRVGRSSSISYCVLLYKSPLSKTAKQRLQILRENNDGFIISKKDLEMRGPGELLGTKQTGNVKLYIANLLRDQKIMPEVYRIAHYINKYYPKQAKALINRWIPQRKYYF